jgi:hypothetical protein
MGVHAQTQRRGALSGEACCWGEGAEQSSPTGPERQGHFRLRGPVKGQLQSANVACRDQSVRAVSACDCPGVRAVVAGEEETTPAGPARQGHVRLRGPVWDRGLLQQLGPECQGCRGSLPLLQRE